VDALGIEVVAGRGFDASRSADASAVLINRAAAERFGWTKPDGHTLAENGQHPHRVIGVVENFHYQSLRQQVDPLVLHLRDNRSFLYARVAPGAVPEAVEHLEAIWTEAGGGAFSYRFLDQTFAAQHRATQRTARLFGVFTGLGLFIACLGLFGLATYTVDRRTKEIGIRKALGATVPHIVGMISGDLVRLIGIAFLAGGPLAYLATHHWLDRFAYRIDLGAGPFLLTAVVVGVIALLTVSTQAYRAARLDPVTTIRDE
jgi:putative ABC transport system permease protein